MDKMGIIQNEVVWNKKYRGMIFAIIAKIQGIAKIPISLCTVTFAMIANFHYDSEIFLAERKTVHSEIFAGIAKFSLWLQNFRNPC